MARSEVLDYPPSTTAAAPNLQVQPNLQSFLANLQSYKDSEPVHAPGVGLLSAFDIRSGLRHGGLKVHPDGRGLCWANSHEGDSLYRQILARERGSRPVDPERLRGLIGEWAALQAAKQPLA